MNAVLFIRSLEERMDTELKRKLSSTIGTISATEIEGLLIRLTDLKTRYLAALLDIGRTRGGIPLKQLEELQRLRTGFSEIEAGFAALKAGIKAGELSVEESYVPYV